MNKIYKYHNISANIINMKLIAKTHYRDHVVVQDHFHLMTYNKRDKDKFYVQNLVTDIIGYYIDIDSIGYSVIFQYIQYWCSQALLSEEGGEGFKIVK